MESSLEPSEKVLSCLFCQANGNPLPDFLSDDILPGPHLSAFFIVTKLLDVSVETCESYLNLDDGQLHPGSWFNTCDRCRCLVHEGWNLVKNIERLKTKLEKLKESLRSSIKNSSKGGKTKSRESRHLKKAFCVADDIRKTIVGQGHSSDELIKEEEFSYSSDEEVGTSSPWFEGDATSENNPEDDPELKFEASDVFPIESRSEKIKIFRTINGKIDSNRYIVLTGVNKGRYQCDICKSSYKKSDKLIKHLNRHENGLIKPPPKITNLFLKANGQIDFKKYLVATGVMKGRYQCNMCKSTIRRASNLVRHLKRHVKFEAPRKRIVCSLCQKLLPDEERRKKHLKKQHPFGRGIGVPFYCDYCHMIYTNPKRLVDHIDLFHLEATSLSCQACNKSGFKTLQLLQLHRCREHNEPMPKGESSGTVKCDHCEATFPSKMTADYHVAKFHWYILLTCKDCRKSFRNFSQLAVHRRAEHNPDRDRLRVCNQCGVNFSTGAGLKTHVDFVHGKQSVIVPQRPNEDAEIGNSGIVQEAPPHESASEDDHGVSSRNEYHTDIPSPYFHDGGGSDNDDDDIAKDPDFKLEESDSENIPSNHSPKRVERVSRKAKRIITKYRKSTLKQTKRLKTVDCVADNIGKSELAQHPPDESINKNGHDNLSDEDLEDIPSSNLEKNANSDDDNRRDPDFKLEAPRTSAAKFKPGIKSLIDAKKYLVRTPGKKERYQCDQCTKGFRRPSNLARHMRHHESNKRTACVICKRFLPDALLYNNHMKKHHPAGHEIGVPFYCDHCHMIFTNPNRVIKHVRLYHPQALPLSCETCSESGFQTQQLLQLHRSREHNEAMPEVESSGPNNCDHCQATFTTKMAVDYHIAKAHLAKLLTCKDCGKSYDRYWKLADHRRIEHDKIMHMCPNCTATFPKKYQLDNHILLEHPDFGDGSKVWVCDQCGVKFIQESQHKKHVDFVHNKIKELCCEQCGKAFARPEELRRHILVHTAPRNQRYKLGPFYCQFCENKFNVRQALYYHMKRHHGDKYSFKCDHCGTGYVNQNKLSLHLFKCKRKNHDMEIETPSSTG